jgi:hypothetical protein
VSLISGQAIKLRRKSDSESLIAPESSGGRRNDDESARCAAPAQLERPSKLLSWRVHEQLSVDEDGIQKKSEASDGTKSNSETEGKNRMGSKILIHTASLGFKFRATREQDTRFRASADYAAATSLSQ